MGLSGTESAVTFLPSLWDEFGRMDWRISWGNDVDLSVRHSINH